MLKKYLKGLKNMKRMRTFLMYALVLVGFIFLSYVLENGLLMGMYDPIERKF